jgi:hypothetical protein
VEIVPDSTSPFAWNAPLSPKLLCLRIGNDYKIIECLDELQELSWDTFHMTGHYRQARPQARPHLGA